jgi:hypothetical protein
MGLMLYWAGLGVVILTLVAIIVLVSLANRRRD